MIGFGTVINSVSVLFIAIAGAIQDGLLGDYSTLAVKSVLDFIIVAVMAYYVTYNLSIGSSESLIGSEQPICPGSFRTLMRERIG